MKSSKLYKPYLIIIFSILLITFIITSICCSQSDAKTTVSVWIEHPEIKGFTLEKPEGWEHLFQPSADVDILMADKEDCDGIEANLYVITRLSFTDKDVSIESLIEKSITSNNDTDNKKYEYVSDSQMEINGMPAGKIIWKVTDDKVVAEQWDLILYKNNLFVFYCFAAQSCWDKYKVIFDKIISSFNIVPE